MDGHCSWPREEVIRTRWQTPPAPLHEPTQLEALDMLYLILSPGMIHLSISQTKELGALAVGGWWSWDWNSTHYDHSGHNVPMGEGPQAQYEASQQSKAERTALDGSLHHM